MSFSPSPRTQYSARRTPCLASWEMNGSAQLNLRFASGFGQCVPPISCVGSGKSSYTRSIRRARKRGKTLVVFVGDGGMNIVRRNAVLVHREGEKFFVGFGGNFERNLFPPSRAYVRELRNSRVRTTHTSNYALSESHKVEFA